MKKANIYFLTGLFGLIYFILEMTVISLYFVYSGPPPLSNILTRSLLEIIGCITLLIFFSSLHNVVININKEFEWLSTIILVLGATYAVMVLTANAIQVGSVWIHKYPTDPTVIGNGGEGAMLIFGPIGRLLSSILLGLTGFVLTGVKILPSWAKWLAYLISLLHIAFVPTLFNLTSPNDFYSANGWGIPVVGSSFILWVLLVGIFFIKRKTCIGLR